MKELLLAKCRKQSVTPAEKRVIQDLCEKRQYHGQAVLHPAERDNGLVETGVEEWCETPKFQREQQRVHGTLRRTILPTTQTRSISEPLHDHYMAQLSPAYELTVMSRLGFELTHLSLTSPDLLLKNTTGTTHDPWSLCTHSRVLDLTFDTCRKSHPVGGKCRYPCLLYTSPSPRDLSTSRMPSSA